MSQRMKHAWARGAQLQYLAGLARCSETSELSGVWINVDDPTWARSTVYRVAPGDQDMEYGPLSNALRRAVKSDLVLRRTELDGPDVLAAWEYLKPELPSAARSPTWSSQPTDSELRMMFLFMAEYLADLGL